MILLNDNYDSFVYNLARYVSELGYPWQLFRNDKISLAELAALKPSHIILSPGPCTPSEAGISLEVISHFKTTPILGVCLGHQAIGQAFGANVVKAVRPMHGMSSTVLHHEQGILKGLHNPLKVARYHSLIIEQKSVPSCLYVTAVSNESEIMALEHKHYPIYGVQFHPESVLTEQGYDLMKNFLSGVR